MTLTFADRYYQTALHERINMERASRAQHLADGLASSHEDYRERVGYLSALRDVLLWSEDITQSLNRETRKSA